MFPQKAELHFTAVTGINTEVKFYKLIDGLYCFLTKPGKKNKLRVYYLSWLRNRILHNDPEVEKKQGWITVGELEGCVHYKVGETEFCDQMCLFVSYVSVNFVYLGYCRNTLYTACYTLLLL